MNGQRDIPDEEVVAPNGVELPRSSATGPASGPLHNASGSELPPAELSRLQTAVVSISVSGIRRLVWASTTVVDHIASSPPVRYVGDIAGEISTALADDSGVDWRRAGDRAETEVARLFAVVVPVVVDSIDPADIIDRIDVNALIEKVDIDAVLNRVDLNAILGSVDLDALFARVDLDELIAQVDIDAVIDRVDIVAISERIRVWNMVATRSSAVASSAVDVARDQGSAFDAVVATALERMRAQNPNTTPGK